MSPTNSQNQKPTAAIVKCPDYQPLHVRDSLIRQFDLLGGMDNFFAFGDRVLIKPNFVMARPPDDPSQTHRSPIIELAKLIKDFGAKPAIGDSPGWGSLKDCINILDLAKPLKKLDVEILDFKKFTRCKIDHKKINISTDCLEADAIINLPKLKAHQQMVATFAIKNIFGCICGKQKAYLHFCKGRSQESFAKFIIELYKYIQPAITIVDAVVAMEGNGPTSGTAKHLGFFLGSSDPVSCEYLCCQLTNVDPKTVPIIQAAKISAFGTDGLEDINIVGDELAICRDFQIPEQIPVKFSLPRVLKSICKQLIFRGSLNR